MRRATRGLLAFCLILAAGMVSAAGRERAPSQILAAQPTPPVVDLLADAERLSRALRLDEAHARADEAVRLAEASGDRAGLAAALRLKGSLFNTAGRGREAAPWLDRALAAAESLGDRAAIVLTLSSLASAALTRGERDQARAFATRAVDVASATGDGRDRARALLVLVAVTDPSPTTMTYLNEAIEIGDRLRDDGILGEALKLRGGREFQEGNLAAAQATLERAVVVWQRQNDVSSLAATLLMLGRVRRAHNDYPGALAQYQRAIDLLASTTERFTLVEAVNASGVALGAMGRHVEAIAAYERGLALARESGNPTLIDFMLGNLGGGLTGSGEYARAIPVLEEVLSRKPDPYIAAFRHNQLALALSRTNRDADAIGHADEAIRLTRELRQVDYLDSRLEARASILLKLGRDDLALTDLSESRAVIETVRTKLVPQDFLKRGYADRVQKTFAMSIEALSRLERAAEALDVSEQARARAFLDLLATRGDTRAAAAPLDAAGVAAAAARLGSTIVSYWVGERGTVIWVSNPQGPPRAVQVRVTRQQLADLVSATTAPIRMPGELRVIDRRPWRDLSRYLVDPIRAYLPPPGARLTVVPHGPLFLLSFAALELRPGRYLLEDFELHYTPSVSTLDAIESAGGGARGEGAWLLVGSPAVLPSVTGTPLAPLPGGAREIASIAALAPGRRATRLEGTHATEAAVHQALVDAPAAVVHFATHGVVSDEATEAPFLALHRSGAAAGADGRLTVDEVYGLRLTADMVVLSACRSGSGQVSSDGILGLTRAFFYAGASSLVTTFWDVSDDVTAALMPWFYREYARTGEKSAALRRAQLSVLADLRAGRLTALVSGRRVALDEHPLLWGAYFLSGRPD